MRKLYLFLFCMIVMLVGVGSAGQTGDDSLVDPPITIDGPSMWFSFGNGAPPPPLHTTGGPFTYTSTGPTHVHVWDCQCVGDEFRVYDFSNLLGDTSDVNSEYPDCLAKSWIDAFGDNRFSNGCFNVPESGDHSIDSYLIQSYTPGSSSGVGGIRVDSGYCPSSSAVPEFPSVAVSIGTIIGMLFAVIVVKKRNN